MSVFEQIEDFSAALSPMQAVMGLDLGTKTIGVAVSDTFLSVATPLETVKRKKFTVDAERLLEIAEDRNVAGIVLGLPAIWTEPRARVASQHERLRAICRA